MRIHREKPTVLIETICRKSHDCVGIVLNLYLWGARRLDPSHPAVFEHRTVALGKFLEVALKFLLFPEDANAVLTLIRRANQI